MARGIQDIGNGLGFIYMVDAAGTNIISFVKNTLEGIRSIRQAGNVVAPFAAKRSAYAVVEFTAVTGAGDITAVDILGMNQIAASVTCTGLTTSQVAEAVAFQINVFNPGLGYDYTAVSLDNFLYIYAPASAGAAPNGNTVTITATGSPVVTYTAQAFKNGADQTESYDTVFGRRFYLDADYGSSGVSGGAAADPTDITNAVEITKYMAMRGQQAGIFTKDILISNYYLSGIDRSGIMTQINMTPIAPPTDVVAKINPEEFVDGDIIFLRASDSGYDITVESAPVVSVGIVGNIYLTNDIPWESAGYNVLMLQFKYDPNIGPIFTEISRSIAASQDVTVGKTIFVSTLGDNATGEAYNLTRHYATVGAARDVAVSGDLIYVFPGDYTEANLQKDGIRFFFCPGCTVNTTTGQTLFNITDENVVIEGNADFLAASGNVVTMNTAATGSIHMQCKSILTTASNTLQLNGGSSYIVVEGDIESDFRCMYFAFNGRHYVKANRIIATAIRTVYNAFSQLCVRVSNTFQGSAHVVCEHMAIDTANGAGGYPLMYFEAIASGGSVIIDAKEMYNRFTGFATDSIYFANTVNYVKITGNLYCDGPGVLARGVNFVQPGGTGSPQWLDFYGNIIVEEGMALYLQACPVCNIYGDIYASTVEIDALLSVAAAVVMLGNAPFAVGGVAYFRLRGNMFVLSSACDAIYKRIQTINHTPGRTELDGICDIHGCSIFVTDLARFAVDGDLATDTDIDNTAITAGAVSNVTVNSPNIVEVGTLVTDARVGKDIAITGKAFPVVTLY